jgi:hypothetical protein
MIDESQEGGDIVSDGRGYTYYFKIDYPDSTRRPGTVRPVSHRPGRLQDVPGTVCFSRLMQTLKVTSRWRNISEKLVIFVASFNHFSSYVLFIT